MAVEDFHNKENIDRGSKASRDLDSHHETGKQFADEAKGIGEVNVKNAQASGDGSYGRNDKRLIEEDDGDKKDESPY